MCGHHHNFILELGIDSFDKTQDVGTFQLTVILFCSDLQGTFEIEVTRFAFAFDFIASAGGFAYHFAQNAFGKVGGDEIVGSVIGLGIFVFGHIVARVEDGFAGFRHIFLELAVDDKHRCCTMCFGRFDFLPPVC